MGRVHSNSRSGVDSTWTPLDSLPNLNEFGRESIWNMGGTVKTSNSGIGIQNLQSMQGASIADF